MMNTTLALLAALVLTTIPDGSLKVDFGNAPDKCQDWAVLSDNVMGGVSKSNLVYTDNAAVLTGDISFDNYGGFSSIKTKFRAVDLSSYTGVKIRFKSANQKFAFTLEDSRNWTRPNYKCKFASKRGDSWEEATLYFKDFKEYVIGQPTGSSMDAAVLKGIVRLGIMTDEKKEGPFSLEIDYVEFFS
ncbi:MAG: CIA30 family protein [Candidatus Kapabacteria bacterium]|nr:CIA30 family protein [Candidatus Kapabacteria bacterium]